ncbi:MAG: hypothetical protein KIC85_09530 [Enterococcus gilvus]|nr:hypothetical protein [Enterococcus gilvus]
MFEEGKFVTAIGSFIVKEVGDEFVELDSFGKGGVEVTDTYVENGFSEITSEGIEKEFDGFTVGDFFKLNGKYKVLRSNDIFTKVQAGEYMLSLPNHKLMEVA